MTILTKPEYIDVKEFPLFIRVTLKSSARKKLFSCALKKIRTIKRDYDSLKDFDTLYGEKKGIILKILSEKPQTAKELRAASGLSSGTVYHFLKQLKSRGTVLKKGSTYQLRRDFHSLYLDEIVKIEEDPVRRRKYGISLKELELAYFLWEPFITVNTQQDPQCSVYTLADAVHRWRTGRTDIPVWALKHLTSSDEFLTKDVTQYHLPPGVPVTPSYENELKLPIQINSDVDKVVIQLLQKICKNNVYTFPKKKGWLFETLHKTFGEFDDSTSRIPLVIIEILKNHYGIKKLNRSAACIPPRIRARWSEKNPLIQIVEESSLLLHVISLSSKSNEGVEITSRSESFLQDIATFIWGLRLGSMTLGKKYKRPHFRVYLSDSKVDVLRRYTHLFQVFPDLQIWLRIPLNRIAEKLVFSNADLGAVEQICYEELTWFVESILRSLGRKEAKNLDYGYKEEIFDYFWEKKIIPSPRSVKELIPEEEEEEYLYVY